MAPVSRNINIEDAPSNCKRFRFAEIAAVYDWVLSSHCNTVSSHCNCLCLLLYWAQKFHVMTLKSTHWTTSLLQPLKTSTVDLLYLVINCLDLKKNCDPYRIEWSEVSWVVSLHPCSELVLISVLKPRGHEWTALPSALNRTNGSWVHLHRNTLLFTHKVKLSSGSIRDHKTDVIFVLKGRILVHVKAPLQ